nr:HNH endonuclease signature motif containing protein [Gordonia jinghuaiqii]
MTITPAQAKELIFAGDALRYRLSFTGHGLACGRIDKHRFLIAVRRTELITDLETMQTVDAHLAEAIFARPPMSTTRFTTMVDAIVATWAPDAIRRRNQRAHDDRNISVRSDRFHPGQARISGALTEADGAAFNAQLTTIATTVHPGDPRTLPQRRADALIALAHGTTTLTCHCPDCTPTPDPETADNDVDADANAKPDSEAVTDVDDATSPAARSCDCDGRSTITAPQATFHIVVNLSTLVGVDNDPAFLDGHGILDADTARSLLADARRTYIHPHPDPGNNTGPGDTDSAALDSEFRYSPPKKLRALVRAGELCCVFPGCNAPVWNLDLDHTDPFDHTDPRRGGPTTERNLKPLCRFHHRIKTFTSWQDHQDEFLHAWFTTPTGHIFLGNAYNGRDLFGRRVPKRPPDHPARTTLDDLRATATRRRQRAEDRWNKANPPPF